MSLIIATGSNLGDRIDNLREARQRLSDIFEYVAGSRIYESVAVEYQDQPDFYNQVLEFKIPDMSPHEVMDRLLNIELSMGRKRDIPKGPRAIDLDIIFWNMISVSDSTLCIPHPAWDQRSFVVRPLRELPFFQTLKKSFKIPREFDIEAKPIDA